MEDKGGGSRGKWCNGGGEYYLVSGLGGKRKGMVGLTRVDWGGFGCVDRVNQGWTGLGKLGPGKG